MNFLAFRKRSSQRILSLLGIWLPCLITIGYVFARPPFVYGSRASLIYFLLAVFCISLISLLKNKTLYLVITSITSIVYSLLAFLDITHYLIFKDVIAPSTIYIIFETNLNESKEFLNMYLRKNLIILLIVFITAVIFGIYFSYKFYTPKFKLNHKKKLIAFILIITSCIVFIRYRSILLPSIIIKSIIEFKKGRTELSKLKITENGDFDNVVHIDSEKETYIIVIGESTTRTHMSLYGYYRETNPLLNQMKDDLVIYNNVKSPHTHTISSLQESLTLENPNSNTIDFNKTIVQLFNSANFDTYLISNQNPIGRYETTTTLITKASDQRIFTTTSRTMLDESVIPFFKEVLNQPKKKKFIIVHLLGTHLNYKERYPVQFEKFKTIPKTIFKHELAFKTINEYDNAVLYNDFIVSSLINEVKKHDEKSYLLYFSDHGEDVYETINQSCHSETKGTIPMYHVPFLLWTSPKFKKVSKKKFMNTSKAYNNKDFIHSAADLSNIKFEGFDYTKSIFYENVNP